MKKHIRQGYILILTGSCSAVVFGVLSKGWGPSGLLRSIINEHIKIGGIPYKYILAICTIITFIGIGRAVLEPKLRLARGKKEDYLKKGAFYLTLLSSLSIGFALSMFILINEVNRVELKIRESTFTRVTASKDDTAREKAKRQNSPDPELNFLYAEREKRRITVASTPDEQTDMPEKINTGFLVAIKREPKIILKACSFFVLGFIPLWIAYFIFYYIISGFKKKTGS